MLRRLAGLIGFWLPCAALAQTLPVQASFVQAPPAQMPPEQTSLTRTPPAQTPPVQTPPAQTPLALHATYETYAAGIHVAEVETGFSFGPWDYQMSLGYHTTGMVGFFFRGHQFDQVDGAWQGPARRTSLSLSAKASGAAWIGWRRSTIIRASR